jgi:hypothetical protein
MEWWLLNYKPNESCTLGWITCIDPYQVTTVPREKIKRQDGLKLYQVMLSHKREKWICMHRDSTLDVVWTVQCSTKVPTVN